MYCMFNSFSLHCISKYNCSADYQKISKFKEENELLSSLPSITHAFLGWNCINTNLYVFYCKKNFSKHQLSLSFVLLRTVTIPIALSNAIILLVSFERYVMLLYSNFNCNKLNKKILGQILTFFGTLQP